VGDPIAQGGRSCNSERLRWRAGLWVAGNQTKNARTRGSRAIVSGRFVVVVGGTAAWMAAASLVTSLSKLGVRVRLVESDEIVTVGVGEATIPPILDFIGQLGIDGDELVREINTTFKLGITYREWTRPGDFYFHPFGPTGFGLGSVSFPAYCLRMFLDGRAARLEQYSVQAARFH